MFLELEIYLSQIYLEDNLLSECFKWIFGTIVLLAFSLKGYIMCLKFFNSLNKVFEHFPNVFGTLCYFKLRRCWSWIKIHFLNINKLNSKVVFKFLNSLFIEKVRDIWSSIYLKIERKKKIFINNPKLWHKNKLVT